jgi:hypothetical protein
MTNIRLNSPALIGDFERFPGLNPADPVTKGAEWKGMEKKEGRAWDEGGKGPGPQLKFRGCAPGTARGNKTGR